MGGAQGGTLRYYVSAWYVVLSGEAEHTDHVQKKLPLASVAVTRSGSVAT